MKRKITLLALASALGALAVMGAISHFAVQRSIQSALAGRLAMAQVIAGSVDYALANNIAMLEGLAAAGPDMAAMEARLEGVYKYSVFGGGVFLAGVDGRFFASFPAGVFDEDSMAEISGAGEALSGKRTVVTGALASSTGAAPGAYVLVPLKTPGGVVMAVAGGKIDPAAAMFTRFAGALPMEAGARMEIIDSHGITLYSADPARIMAQSDHNKFLANLIAQHKPAVDLCHNCHQGAGEGDGKSQDVLVFTPLQKAPWGVAVMEPKKNIFAPASDLKYAFLAMGLAYAALTALLAMGLSESIAKPIRELTEASARLAREDLSTPIPPRHGGEIGALANSFETMRVRLARAMEDIRDYGVTLEKRVMDRTLELETQRRRLATLLDQALKAQEEERLRIARELHDETSAALLALGMGMEVAVMALRKKELSEDLLLEGKARAAKLLAGVKRIIHDLRPPALDDLGFVSSIRWLLDTHMPQMGIEYSLTVDGAAAQEAAGTLDKGAELRLFRAIQEAVINIARHSGAKRAAVTLAARDGGLEATVEDDGAGFDKEAVYALMDSGHASGFGLMGMKERVAQINGTMEVETAIGKGTKIRLFVPAGNGKRDHV